MGDLRQQEPEAAGHSTSTIRTQRDGCILILLSSSAYIIPDPSQGTSSPIVKMAVPLSVKIVPHGHAQSPSARWFWILSSWQLIPTITCKNLTSMPLHQAPLKCPSLSCWICLRIGVAWATHTLFMYLPQLTCTPGGSQPLSTDQKSTQSNHGDSMYSLIPYYEETLCPSWGTLAYTLAVAAWGPSVIWLAQQRPSPCAHFTWAGTETGTDGLRSPA